MNFLEKAKKAQEEALRILEQKKNEEEIIEKSESGISNIPNYTLFQFMECLTSKKVSWDELGVINQKNFNPFMINKLFSMVPDFVIFLTEVQPILNRLTNEMFYKYLYNFLPEDKFNYLWVNETKENFEYDKDIILVLCDYFKEKKDNVKKYYKMLPSLELISLLKAYGWNDEKINKKLKLN